MAKKGKANNGLPRNNGGLPRSIHKHTHITPQKMIKAIKGSGGLKTVIAQRMGCHWSGVYWSLKFREGPEWDKAREAFKEEEEAVGDIAEGTIQECIQQRLDLSVAGQNARWLLGTKYSNRGFREKSTVRVEGGDNPLKIDVEHHVRIEDLDLDFETRKTILEAIRKSKEKNLNRSTINYSATSLIDGNGNGGRA